MSKYYVIILGVIVLIAVWANSANAQNIAGQYQVKVNGDNVYMDRSPTTRSISDNTTLKVEQSGDQVTMEFGTFASASAATIFKGKVGNQRFSAVWWHQGSEHETKVIWGSVSGNTLRGRMIYPRVAYRSGLVPGWVEISFTASKEPELQEDCLSFNPDRLQVRRDDGRWLLTDGGSRMKLFDNRSEAMRSLNTIKQYKMNSHCFVGRPNASMEYWLVDNQSPSGSTTGEDCIGFNPENLRLQQEGSQWLMTDGRSRMRIFPNREEARQALAIIKKHGFNRTCYIGRPDPPMTYFRK